MLERCLIPCCCCFSGLVDYTAIGLLSQIFRRPNVNLVMMLWNITHDGTSSKNGLRHGFAKWSQTLTVLRRKKLTALSPRGYKERHSKSNKAAYRAAGRRERRSGRSRSACDTDAVIRIQHAIDSELHGPMKPGAKVDAADGESFLVADIGGTNARFAISASRRQTGGEPVIESLRVYRCDAFDSFGAAVQSYRESVGGSLPRSACIAVAGPVADHAVEMTNRNWSVGAEDLRREFGFETVQLVNDAAAIAAGVKTIDEADLLQVKRGRAADGPALVITAGTGLGVAALLPTEDSWQAFATEAGHMALTPRTGQEREIIEHLRGDHGRVSAELLLSGPGIARLYRALAAVNGYSVEHADSEAITAAALHESDPLSMRSIGLFRGLLGNLAGELALAFGARGGVYLAGGIFRRLAPLLCDDREFSEAFRDKGAMAAFVDDLPVWLATTPRLGLRGARLMLERKFARPAE